MFGLQMLEVAIGLIFIYLLLSLVVTAANELLASLTRRRSLTLWRGVINILGEEEFARRVYDHPLIRSLRQDERRRPSYIPSRTFALAVLDTVMPATAAAGDRLAELRAALQSRLSPPQPGAEGAAPRTGYLNRFVAQSLAVLLEDARDDIDKFKENIEIWFNSSMERVSGWYKRRTQWILFTLAIVVTVFANADTISMAGVLWREPVVRAALAAQAQAFAEKSRSEAETSEPAAEIQSAANNLVRAMQQVEGLAMPLGWTSAPAPSEQPQRAGERDPQIREWPGFSGGRWWRAIRYHFFGWLLTTLAVSLGAPFWFDMLNKVISIRAAGKAPEEAQKLPKEVPLPREAGGTPVEPQR